MLRRALVVALAALGLAVAGCAPRVAPPIPEGEDYVRPTTDGETVSAREERTLDEAWRRVLAGDAERAARDYQRFLRRRPGFVPAETGLSYARLRERRITAAAAGFASVVERRPDYMPALVGAAAAALRLDRGDEALRLYRRALEGHPSDALLRRRVGELKVQLAERHMAAAQAALDAGDREGTAAEYRAALDAAPELSAVRLELAELLVGQGDVAGAVTALEGDPSGERAVSLRRGSLLLAQERYEEARSVYRELTERDPSDTEASRGEQAAQDALDFQAQPEEYRRIAQASRVSRADLAALLAVKVSALTRLPVSGSRVAVDISASWARPHIATILGLGIMDLYPNHTFQPEATVRRGELARAVARVLDLLGVASGEAPVPTDMGPSHIDRGAVARVVGSGVMPLGRDGAFEPWRPVSGREAVETVEALARLVGP